MKYVIRDIDTDEILDILEMSDDQVEQYELNNPEHYVLSEEEDINETDKDEMIDISDLW